MELPPAAALWLDPLRMSRHRYVVTYSINDQHAADESVDPSELGRTAHGVALMLAELGS